MKKLLLVLIACAVLAVSLTACQTSDLPSGKPSQTDGAQPSPAPSAALRMIQREGDRTPNTDDDAWNASLPAELPATGIAYEDLSASVLLQEHPMTNAMEHAVVLIASRAELDAFFLVDGTCPATLQADYDRLCEVDFTTKSVLYVKGYHSHILGVSLRGVTVHEGALLVAYTSDRTGDFISPAFEHWRSVLVLNKADLPNGGTDLDIFSCICYPQVEELSAGAHPYAYPANVFAPIRYIFTEDNA